MSQLLRASVYHFIVAQGDAYKARLAVLLAYRLAGYLDREAAGSRVAVAWASTLFMAPRASSLYFVQQFAAAFAKEACTCTSIIFLVLSNWNL